MAMIIEAKTSGFIWRNITYHFGIPYTLVTNNGRQFDNKKYWKICSNIGIKCYFFAPMHLQANNQVEAFNKVIKHHLKTRLGNYKGVWANEFPNMLWAYRTTPYNAIRGTLYFLAFGAEVLVLIEIGLPSYRIAHYSPNGNNNVLRAESDLLEERQEITSLRAATYK